jgi:hypothetical protein
LQAIVDAIIAAHPDGLTLDELSEELSTRAATYADIDEIIGALEEAGIDLDTPAPAPRPEELARVLAAVRAFAAETGKRPSVSTSDCSFAATPRRGRWASSSGSAAARRGHDWGQAPLRQRACAAERAG